MDNICPNCGFQGTTEAFIRSLREFGVCDDFAEYEDEGPPEDWGGLS